MDVKTDNSQAWEIFITNLMVEDSRVHKWRKFYRRVKAYFRNQQQADQREDQIDTVEDEKVSMSEDEIDEMALELKKTWGEQSGYDLANQSVREEIKQLRAQTEALFQKLSQK